MEDCMEHESGSIRDRFGALASMRLNRRSFVRFTALAAGAVVSVPLLAACGGDDDDTPTATNTTAASADATETTTDAAEPTETTEAAASPTSGDASPTAGGASPTTGTGSGGMIDGGDRNMGKTMEVPDSPGGTMIEAS